MSLGALTSDDFPDFDLRDYLRGQGADVDAYEAAAQAYVDVVASVRSTSVTDECEWSPNLKATGASGRPSG